MDEVSPRDNPPGLDERVDAVFAADGPLAQQLPAFEPRTGQRVMATAAARALETGGVLLAEAGTGTGKTAGFTLPLLQKLGSRHGKNPLYFTHPDAEVQVTLGDGSTRKLKTSQTNDGGYLLVGGAIQRTTIQYAPLTAREEPPWLGSYSLLQPPHFASTIGGLKGCDYGSNEVLY